MSQSTTQPTSRNGIPSDRIPRHQEGFALRFDHLTHHIPDLAAAVKAYGELGFTFSPVVPSPAQGTGRAFCRSGSTYLELIGVDDLETFRSIQRMRQERYPNLLFQTVELVEAGGGISSFAVEVPDLDQVVECLRAQGLPIAEPVRRGKVREDGKSDWAMAGLTEGPTWLPFFIEYAMAEEERAARAPASTWSIDQLILETADPAEGARQLATLLGLEIRMAGPERYVVPLPGGAIHLVQGRAERVTGVLFAGIHLPMVEVSGLWLSSR